MANFANNDDDLFDYDPSTETSTPAEDIVTNVTEEITGLSKDQEKLLKQVRDNLSNADADLVGDEKGKVNTLRSELYTSFQAAINALVDNVRVEHFSKAINVTLDELTQGRFSMLNLFYKYELKICRKTTLIALFEKVLLTQNDDEKSPFIETISNLLNIQISPLYIKSSFATTNKILLHSLTIDKIIYQFLAEKLNLPVVKDIIEYDFTGSVEQIEQRMKTFTFDNYSKTIEHTMLTAFFSADKTENTNTLQQMLEQSFDTKIEYAHGMRTLQDE